jgi:hypothetical protein
MEQQSTVSVQIEKDEAKQQPQLPKVFIGIPIGPPKLYSTYYMIASLANLNYPNVELHWAVTGAVDDSRFSDYRDRLTKLCSAVKWPEGWNNHIHYVTLTKERRLQNYGPILENKTVLRNAFLDSDADYFLLLGGDNPPPRDAVKALMSVDADVAMGTCYQRPEATNLGVYPLVWRFLVKLEEIDALDIDEVNKLQMRMNWLTSPSVVNVSYDPDFTKQNVEWYVCGGDGCALIKRRVLETIDWGVVPPDSAACSEDMYFMTQALYYGYTTACLPKLHIAHMSESGLGV